jgi:ABC-type multidrug transport system fused ATPase/permease subunit
MLLKSLGPLVPYLKKYRRSYIIGTICVFCNNGVWILLPQVIGRAVDDLRLGVTHHKMATYALLILAVAATKGIFQFLTRWVVIGVSREIEFDLRNDLFRHLEGLSYSFYQRTRTGDIMARATNDLNAVRMLLGPAIMYSANTLLTFVVALSVMISIDPRLALWSLIPLPFVSISVKLFGTAIHKRFEQIQAQLSDLSAVAQEAFAGVRVVRAYRQESELPETWPLKQMVQQLASGAETPAGGKKSSTKKSSASKKSRGPSWCRTVGQRGRNTKDSRMPTSLSAAIPGISARLCRAASRRSWPATLRSRSRMAAGGCNWPLG